MMLVRWLGDQLIEKIVESTREAIDETTAAAAEKANQATLNPPPHTASGHRWHGVTPREIDTVVNEPARQSGLGLTGRFGDTAGQGNYGLMLERMQPYMRPAADEEFPRLPERIKGRLDG